MAHGANTKYSTKAILGIVGMLTFGTGTMIASKLMLDTSGCPIYYEWEYGPEGYEEWEHGKCPPELRKKFEKPWFQTAAMFLGMFCCIFGFIGQEIHQHRKMKKLAAQEAEKRAAAEEEDETLVAPPEPQPAHVSFRQKVKTWAFWKPYIIIVCPACFDMIATAVMTMGLLYIDVSVMQMLRGVMTVFTSCFNILFLRRRIRLYQWISVLVTVCACAIVGVSCVLGAAGSTTAKPWDKQLYGCFLVVCSQFIQSGQIVCEDFLLSDIDAVPLQVVGMEGFWGLFVTVFIISPLMMWGVPGGDHGASEDFVDSFYMVADNVLILVFTLIYIVCILFLNWAGMVVTAETSSVVRTIFEAVRTSAIWVTDLFIFYVAAPNSVYGETWTTYSWLQLAGFVLLVFSSQMYNGYAKYPRLFKYKFDDDGTTLGVFACCPDKVPKPKSAAGAADADSKEEEPLLESHDEAEDVEEA